MSDSFVHLHTHTEYSLLDGAARINDAVAAAAADGQPALGITDHGNMYGVIDFYKACRASGVKPVIGTEAYMALNSREERPSRRSGRVDDSGGDSAEGTKLYYHLTLLAESDIGYKNLIKLSSRAFLEGYYYKPRMDWDMFSDHADGLIATTGCLGSVVQQALLANDYDEALRRARRLQDIFGRESMYVELQDHGIKAQHDCNPHLIRIARDLGAPLLATNDLHYVHQEDHAAHDALLCVQTKAKLADTKRFKFEGDQHYLKSAAEMRSLFADYPDSCDNTLLIAERANVDIKFGQDLLPLFDVPDDHADADGYLRHLAFEGAKERWRDAIPSTAAERLDYELRVISEMGFSAYFLITWDLIRYARERDIRVGPGRGSAAGCAVAYCLRITDLDPIRYGLLFERFLNPDRVSMPDIDIDFDDRYRDEMIRYASRKYGDDHVAQVITFSTIKARAAVRDAARILNEPYSLGDLLSKSVPDFATLEDCIDNPGSVPDAEKVEAFRRLHDRDAAARRVIEVARGFEGLIRQDSIHAAAVVISPEPLIEMLPVQRKPDKGVLGPMVTQFEMGPVEDLGLLKMDFLGLRTLSIIDEAVRLIKASAGADIRVEHLPLDDRPTFELLCAGDTMGIFQLESEGMRTLLRSLRPTTFDDIAALVALYRPGPMAAKMHESYARRKNDLEPSTPIHDDLTEVLAETYGLMIYQESMMRVAQEIASYSMADADDLRKACGKKQRDRIAAHRDKFVQGAVANGYDAGIGVQIFDTIEPFADYAFNKSHAYAYGLISYQTAYLKANYPAEFLAAILTGTKHHIDKAGVYLSDCRAHHIEVLTPDVNRSHVNFGTDVHGRITFGLSAVRNIGDQAAAAIVAARDEGGPFADIHDFAERVPRDSINKRAVEALVKTGGFESCGHPRAGLLEIYETAVDAAHRRAADAEAGLQSLFSSDEATADHDRVKVPESETTTDALLDWEHEMLGMYVSGHPLEDYLETLEQRITNAVSDLPGLAELIGDSDTDEEEQTVIGGLIRDLRFFYTRKSAERMAGFVVEDMDATFPAVVFPSVLPEVEHMLRDDDVVMLTGRVIKNHNQEPSFAVNDVEPAAKRQTSAARRVVPPPEEAPVTAAPYVADVTHLPVGDGWLDDLAGVLEQHPGNTPVHVKVGDQVVQLALSIDAEAAEAQLAELTR